MFLRKNKLANNINKGRLNKRAFTLIELLAIIVILAIIAVITVPIILNVIDNSKKGAAIDSAYGYKEAIEKGFLTDLSMDHSMELPNGIYVIDSSGKLVNSGGSVLSVDVSGTEPDDGWVQLDKGYVEAYSLKFGDYVVTKYQDTEVSATKNGEIAENVEAREARLESERQQRAIVSAKNIALSQSGTTEVKDITDGWVAFINGEVVAYSMKIEEGDYTYVVTDLNVTSENTNAVADRTITELASKTSTEQSIIYYKVDSYVKTLLQSNPSVDNEAVYTVDDMSNVTTNKADLGWVRFKKVGEIVTVTDYSLTYGNIIVDYVSLTDGNYVSEIVSTGRSKPVIINPTSGIKVGNVQYYIGNNSILFDPTSNTGRCSNYTSANSTVGFNGVDNLTSEQTSCLKWYIYSVDDKGTETESDDVVNMILDHNTTGSIEWNSSDPYSGPSSAFLTQFETDTIGWTSSKIISPSSYTATWPKTTPPRTYTITYSTKARLIEADEVAKIKGDNSWTYSNSSLSSGISTNNYDFLKANLSTGFENGGYWTSSPLGASCYSSCTYYVWLVHESGSLDYQFSSFSSFGIRPVITVLKSDIF